MINNRLKEWEEDLWVFRLKDEEMIYKMKEILDDEYDK